MTSTNIHDIAVLNGLVQTTIDSVDVYAEAARKVNDAYLSGSFSRWSEDRSQVVGALKAHVSTLGGDAELGGTTLGSAHRLFAKLHEALVSGDTPIVDEVECGEDRIKHRFEEALRDTALSVPTRRVIERAYVSVLAGHEQASALKRSRRG
ncbi:PA2169 family four-helix-bundle protein [Rhodanobacter hydrolyticus]|uniref:PA2169 family four-helix-bundle protein n=1 Tax=Rhodanobacter hydrolyticus TaxID=2250595 RepID=A0ABW8JBX9_9GAMM